MARLLISLFCSCLLFTSIKSIESNFGQTGEKSIRQDGGSGTLLDGVKSNPNLEVFEQVLPLAALDSRLGAEVRLSTVFAPTDEAFGRLALALTGQSSSNATEIVNLLLPLLTQVNQIAETNELVPSVVDLLDYHILPLSTTLASLRGTFFETTSTYTAGMEEPVELGLFNGRLVDRDPTANTTFSRRNIRFSNGYLNIIDDVLLPIPAADILSLFSTPSPMPSKEMDDDGKDMMTPTPSMTKEMDDNDGMPMPSPEDKDGPEMSVSPKPEESMPVEMSSPSAQTSDISEEPSTPPEDNGDPVCFPASSIVHLSNGQKVRMDQLQPGAHVLTSTSSNTPSRVFLFTHRNPTKRTRFVRISTKCGQTLTMSASHYLRNSDGHLIAAGAVKKHSTKLQTVNGVCEVEEMEVVTGKGVYAPHSMHGDLVVDGVVVSGYSKAVHPVVAHGLLAPVRWYARQFDVKEPLGSIFYNGADWILRFIPGGKDVHQKNRF